MGGPLWGRVGTEPSVPSVAAAAGVACGWPGTLPAPSVPLMSAGSRGSGGMNVSMILGAAAAATGSWPPAGVAGVAGLAPQPWLPLGRGVPKLLGRLGEDSGVVPGSGFGTGGPTRRARRFLR